MAAIARRIALSVLNSLETSSLTLDSLLSQAFEERPKLIQPDRALANELVFGVIRWRGRLDWVIKHLSNTPVRKIDPSVLNTVRLGLYQILFLSRVPVSAAVNDSVELAKEKAPSWVVGFVNAVLRTAVDRAKDLPLPHERDDPVAAISVRESHPPWMVRRWLERLGLEETTTLCRANNQIPPVTIRTNTLQVSRERLSSSLTALAREITPTRFAPEGLALKGLKQPIAEMPPFGRGWFQVQDEAAQLIGHLLDPKPDDTILDACAGFGGKTGHIAQLINNSGAIQAMDQHAWKLQSLETSMKRLGISIVTTWQHDLTTPAPKGLKGVFNRVLLDAPCSGLGVIRRNPDTKWKKQEKDLTRFHDTQLGFLASLAPLVKRGGWLIYCVCSLEPEEGDRVVEDFLKSHRDFAICRSPSRLPEMDNHFFDGSGMFRTVPQEHSMDGFFAVRLQRVAL